MRRGALEVHFFLGQVLAAVVNDALRIAHDQVLGGHAQRQIQAGAADRRGSGPVEHHAHLAELLADELGGVQQGGAGDDGRSVLVVVHDGNVEFFAQPLLDVKAVGRGDVLEVDAAKGGRQNLDGFDKLIGVFGVELEVKHVDVCKNFEQHALALHHGLGGERTDVAEAQDCGAVADYGHEVALGGVAVGVLGVGGDLEAGLGHARRVGNAQVALRI